MSIEIKTSTRQELVRQGRNEFELDEHVERHYAEIWLDGICYRTEARDAAHARALVMAATRSLVATLQRP